MTRIDLQDRAQYLSLALFAQEMVSVLMQYVDENVIPTLKTALEDALTSLEGAERASVPFQRRAAFTSYEHSEPYRKFGNRGSATGPNG